MVARGHCWTGIACRQNCLLRPDQRGFRNQQAHAGAGDLRMVSSSVVGAVTPEPSAMLKLPGRQAPKYGIWGDVVGSVGREELGWQEVMGGARFAGGR